MPKESNISDKRYTCAGCGEEFRHWYNFRKHINNCFAYKIGDYGEQED